MLFVPYWLQIPGKKQDALLTHVKTLTNNVTTLRRNVDTWKNDWKSYFRKLSTMFYTIDRPVMEDSYKNLPSLEVLNKQFKITQEVLNELKSFITTEEKTLNNWIERVNALNPKKSVQQDNSSD